MLPQEIIRRKRDGIVLSTDEITDFIGGMTRGTISESQAAAFAMAVWFRGMNRDEVVALTLAMRDSGETLDWSDLDRPVVDKHSTGGVGDNVSLMLAPVAAACGLAVPMISGRGLGHTGGTLDKLESIPGYNIAPSEAVFRQTVRNAGCAIIGQTGDLAPADRRLYAIRDVTATVDSIPLITASILSKKLAAGLENLVLDVKIGNGAFMSGMDEAENLARSLVEVANGAGVRTTALITDMNWPLADAAGNVLEIVNCLDFLHGRKSGTRLEAVVIALAAEMLVVSGIAVDLSDATRRVRQALDSGAALEIFGRMVHSLGGPVDLVERSGQYLETAPVRLDVKARQSGWLTACDTRGIGMAVIGLGGGRRKSTDNIDHRVGASDILPHGTQVATGDVIAVVHAADLVSAERAVAELGDCFTVGPDKPQSADPILAHIG